MTEKPYLKPADEPLHPSVLECIAIHMDAENQRQKDIREKFNKMFVAEVDKIMASGSKILSNHNY